MMVEASIAIEMALFIARWSGGGDALAELVAWQGLVDDDVVLVAGPVELVAWQALVDDDVVLVAGPALLHHQQALVDDVVLVAGPALQHLRDEGTSC